MQQLIAGPGATINILRPIFYTSGAIHSWERADVRLNDCALRTGCDWTQYNANMTRSNTNFNQLNQLLQNLTAQLQSTNQRITETQAKLGQLEALIGKSTSEIKADYTQMRQATDMLSSEIKDATTKTRELEPALRAIVADTRHELIGMLEAKPELDVKMLGSG